MSAPDTPGQPLRILWCIELEYEHGMHHGGSLRYFNLSRELIALGHEVHFASYRRSEDDPAQKARFLEELAGAGAISGHFETQYCVPRWRGRMARLTGSVGVENRLLRGLRDATHHRVDDFVSSHRIDVCLFNCRPMLFLVPELARRLPVVIDWTDSDVLFWVRQIGRHVTGREVMRLPYGLRRLQEAYAQERYYGRRSHANLVVSPVDKRWLDRVNGLRGRNQVLMNGVRLAVSRPLSRPFQGRRAPPPVDGRLVFSGNMSFPPNYEAAIWFIDHVLPLVHERAPGISFFVAGANPVPALLERARPGVEIAGFVEDMELEIARGRVYVAPLVSGGGFKNKIVEALAAGQYVIATSRAVEFLEPSMRAQLLVGDTPEAMARHILDYVAHPDAYADRVAALQQIVRTQFTWARRAVELLDVVASARTRFIASTRGSR